jgi:hypothetical protein
VLLQVQAPVTVLVPLLQALLAAVQVALLQEVQVPRHLALLVALLPALQVLLLLLHLPVVQVPPQVGPQVAHPVMLLLLVQVNHQVTSLAAPLASHLLEASTPVVHLVTVLL